MRVIIPLAGCDLNAIFRSRISFFLSVNDSFGGFFLREDAQPRGGVFGKEMGEIGLCNQRLMGLPNPMVLWETEVDGVG